MGYKEADYKYMDDSCCLQKFVFILHSEQIRATAV